MRVTYRSAPGAVVRREPVTFNHGVEGSSPSALTIFEILQLKTFDYLPGLANRPSRLATFLFAFGLALPEPVDGLDADLFAVSASM